MLAMGPRGFSFFKIRWKCDHGSTNNETRHSV